MNRSHWIAAVLAGALVACGTDHPFERGAAGAGPVAPPAPKVSFQEEVVPALQSCATCHVGGTGNWTYDGGPQAYAQALEHVDLAAPAQSMLLRKATNDAAHGGGPQFAEGSAEYETVLAWIEAGALDE